MPLYTHVMRMAVLPAAFSVLVLVAGCGSDRVLRTNYVEFSPEQRQELLAEGERVYRIQEGDVLNIVFAYLEELNQTGIVVLPDGSVSLLGLDRVVLAGRTLAGADSLLTAAYSHEYRDPALSVVVTESQGRRVYVLGEVNQPGLYPVPHGGVGILGAIAAAGGTTEDAAKDGTVLVRVSPEGYLCQEVDLSAFHQVDGAALATLDLEAFDVVYVPRSRIADFGYFSRNVLFGLLNVANVIAEGRYIATGSVLRR